MLWTQLMEPEPIRWVQRLSVDLPRLTRSCMILWYIYTIRYLILVYPGAKSEEIKQLWAFGGLYSVQWIFPVAAIPTSDHIENGWDKFGPKNVTTTFWDLRVFGTTSTLRSFFWHFFAGNFGRDCLAFTCFHPQKGKLEEQVVQNVYGALRAKSIDYTGLFYRIFKWFLVTSWVLQFSPCLSRKDTQHITLPISSAKSWSKCSLRTLPALETGVRILYKVVPHS